jgi:hypothetical protein
MPLPGDKREGIVLGVLEDFERADDVKGLGRLVVLCSALQERSAGAYTGLRDSERISVWLEPHVPDAARQDCSG